MRGLIVIFGCVISVSYVSTGYVARNTEVGDFAGKCTYDEDCHTPNAFCKQHKKCDCKAGYRYDQRYDSCQPTQVGLICNDNIECSAIKNSRCEDGVCQCEGGHGTLNSKSECIPARQVMADCVSDANCQVVDTNTLCNVMTKRCECVPTFHLAWNSQQCVPDKRLRDACQAHEECVLTPDQQDLVECRTDNFNTKKCLCRPGVGEENNKCTRGAPDGAAQMVASTVILLLGIVGLSAFN